MFINSLFHKMSDCFKYSNYCTDKASIYPYTRNILSAFENAFEHSRFCHLLTCETRSKRAYFRMFKSVLPHSRIHWKKE